VLRRSSIGCSGSRTKRTGLGSGLSHSALWCRALRVRAPNSRRCYCIFGAGSCVPSDRSISGWQGARRYAHRSHRRPFPHRPTKVESEVVRENEIRKAEVAVAMPPATDAGLVFVGRIHTPWTSRMETPRRAGRTGRSAASRYSSRGVRRSTASINSSASRSFIGCTCLGVTW
jgi:hypothetical protein